MTDKDAFSSALLRALVDTLEQPEGRNSGEQCHGVGIHCIAGRGMRFDFGGVTIERLVVEVSGE